MIICYHLKYLLVIVYEMYYLFIKIMWSWFGFWFMTPIYHGRCSKNMPISSLLEIHSNCIPIDRLIGVYDLAIGVDSIYIKKPKLCFHACPLPCGRCHRT